MENTETSATGNEDWESEVNEKGFELSHGCAVLFDLFHSCSCKM